VAVALLARAGLVDGHEREGDLGTVGQFGPVGIREAAGQDAGVREPRLAVAAENSSMPPTVGTTRP
jgi:hypothetical protein